jgi:hypothetical protein
MTRWLLVLAPVAAGALLGCSSSPSTTPDASGAGGSTTGTGAGGAAGTDTGTGAGTGTGGADGAAPGDGAAPADPNAAPACAALADALCAKLMSCSPFALGALYGDATTCKQRLALGCVVKFGAPGTSATPAMATACAASLPSLACATFATGDFGAACAAQPGTLANGAACGDDAQCASTFCARAADAVCGVCAAATSAGSACVRGSCSAGTVCPMGRTTCIAPVAGQVGDMCTTLEQCDLGHGVGCNTTTSRCIMLTQAPAGGMCGANSLLASSFAVCPASGSCSAILNGTCSAAAADSAACSTATTGPACMPPAKCVGGRCTLPAPASCH